MIKAILIIFLYLVIAGPLALSMGKVLNKMQKFYPVVKDEAD